MEVTTVLLLLFAGVLALIVQLVRRRLNYWKERGIPADEPHPFYGNFQGLLQTRSFADITSGLYHRHRGKGPFAGVHFFQSPCVLLLDPELIKQVLIKDFVNFTDRGLFCNPKNDPLTGHLFVLDGQEWRTMRHKLSPTFSSGKMKYMFPTILKVSDQLVEAMRIKITDCNGIIEVKDLMARFTTDVIGSCAFGIDCNSLKDPKAEFRRMGRQVFTKFRHSQFAMSLIHGFPEWARALGVRVLTDEVHNFFMRIVCETVEYREKRNVQRNDFLNLLMDINKNKKLSGENDAMNCFTLDEMAAQAFVFFVAGFETSSFTISVCLYELARNQQIQDRLRAEIVEVLKRHNNVLTYESLEEMHYMKQVLAETLRKYPVLSHLNRLAVKDYVVPGHPNYVIKKGMRVFVSILGIHYDPQYYPEPEKFDPERFAFEAVQARDPAHYFPFGMGPRTCIAKRFAYMQIRVGLIYIMKNFHVSFCAKTQNALQFDPEQFILITKGGISLKFQELSQQQNVE